MSWILSYAIFRYDAGVHVTFMLIWCRFTLDFVRMQSRPENDTGALCRRQDAFGGPHGSGVDFKKGSRFHSGRSDTSSCNTCLCAMRNGGGG